VLQQDMERVMQKLADSQMAQVQSGDDMASKTKEISSLKAKVEGICLAT
jgi:hypothetical protein